MLEANRSELHQSRPDRTLKQKIALVGNPNSGKSTLFNTLTNGRQRTGNWTGITVQQTIGTAQHKQSTFDVVDLPGIYNIQPSEHTDKLDEQLARKFIQEHPADVIINVVDATTLARGLFLTTQLRELGTPMIVALTMFDSARKQNLVIDCAKVSTQLGCPVVPIDARRQASSKEILESVQLVLNEPQQRPIEIADRYRFIDQLVRDVLTPTRLSQSVTDRIDNWVLNRYLSIPIFLLVMYAMFFFSINVGGVLIDFFDIVGGMVFVEVPRTLLQSINCPSWITALVSDGVGGGIQLVGTFVPIIGALFLFQAILEDSGYMGRIAFIMDKPLRSIGLTGRALVPLLVGFGCNVPSVMSTRSLDTNSDRILTTVMAPFMSCGARLTVYVLFVAAFFPEHGQNIVFLLYLIGVIVALGTAWIVKKQIFRTVRTTFIQELPKYHVPNWRNLVRMTWHRLIDFVWRAGRAIVLVVVLLNFVSSIGIDGSSGNEDSERSILSAIGKSVTPVLAPLGIDQENWPATVGIFTGFFAKEVVVGTLDALYTPSVDRTESYSFDSAFRSAIVTVPINLVALGSSFLDPLGLKDTNTETLNEYAVANEVDINTVRAMQELFDGKLGAFSYLLFVLLYVPCVATVGVIIREIGGYWATFSVVWSTTIAYATAVVVYQLGQFGSTPRTATLWIVGMLVLATISISLLANWGRRKVASPSRLLAVKQLD